MSGEKQGSGLVKVIALGLVGTIVVAGGIIYVRDMMATKAAEAARLKAETEAKASMTAAVEKNDPEAIMAAWGKAEQFYFDDVKMQWAAANAYLAKGKLENAMRPLGNLLGLQQDDPAPRVELGRVFALLNRMPEARKQFEEAVRLNAKHVPALTSLAELDLKDGKADQATERFVAIVGAAPKPEVTKAATAAVSALSAAGKAELALKVIDAAKKAGGEGLDALEAEQLLQSGKKDEAAKALEKAAAANEKDPNGYLKAAEAFAALGQWDAVERNARAALKAQDGGKQHVMIANALLATNKAKDAAAEVPAIVGFANAVTATDVSDVAKKFVDAKRGDDAIALLKAVAPNAKGADQVLVLKQLAETLKAKKGATKDHDAVCEQLKAAAPEEACP